MDLQTIGIIRGNELTPSSNPYLKQMNTWGMKLIFIDREAYKNKILPSYLPDLEQYMIIPEGGYSEIGINSVASMCQEINEQGNFDYITLAVGTGTTALGLSKYLNLSKIVGILSLNNLIEIQNHQNELNFFPKNLYLFEQKDIKKYGKKEEKLIEFCAEFELKHQIKIEPIYTGKMLYRLYELILENYFPSNSNILAVHTGGVK